MHEYEDLFKPIRRYFQLAMIDLLDINWKPNIRSVITLCLITLLVNGLITFVCRNFGDIENIQDAVESAAVLGSACAMYAKTVVLLCKRKEVISFSDKIKLKYSQSLNEHPDITIAFAKHFTLIKNVFSVTLYLLPTLYAVASLLGGGERRLLILMEIPFLPKEGWPFFQIVYAMQATVTWFGCNLVLGSEFLTFFFIQYVCCRIEILANMIEHWNDNLKHNHREFEARKNNFLLEEIVRYHTSVKENMCTIKNIFSPILVASLLSNTLVICMCLLMISQNPQPKMCSHIIFSLGQTFMCCYVGNLLINQNENLVKAVMLVDFDYLDVPARKSYMNVVQNACNPIKLESYFVTVDMALFFKVVKFAYSVFSLMRTRM